MSSFLADCKSLTAQMGQFVKEGLVAINLELLQNKAKGVSLTNAVKEVLPPTETTIDIAKKLFGFSVSSAAIASSAFYLGYHFANKNQHPLSKHNSHTYQVNTKSNPLLFSSIKQLCFLCVPLKIEQVLCKLKMNKVQLQTVMTMMMNEMLKGLNPVTHDAADVKMFPAYVRSL